MLFSFGLILLFALTLGEVLRKLKLPPLVGMLMVGIALGPYALNLISTDILNISADLRQIALVVILMRAGLSLDLKTLKKVGRPAVLMCFVPALFEIVATVIFAPILFGIPYLEALIMGAVLGAVSPAVIVPRMIAISKSGYGRDKGIAELVMAGASVDDIFVIVLFGVFLSAFSMGNFDFWGLVAIPFSIVFGLIVGVAVGILCVFIFRKLKANTTAESLILLGICVLFVVAESKISDYIPFSGLLGVMAVGCTICKLNNSLAKEFSQSFNSIWVFAEILLFVLVGATVDVGYAINAGLLAILLLAVVLLIRVVGVFVCTVKTPLNIKERVFCAISYLPKATVQASIGAIPLAVGVPSGGLILTVAVLSILITAPIGAFAIDLSYKRLLLPPVDINI